MNFKHFDILSKDIEDLQMIKQIMVTEIIISVILLFVGIAALITIHMCIVGRAFRRGLGSDSSADGVLQRSSVAIIRATGITPQELKKLPCFEYNKEAWDKGTGPTTDCVVCLDNFKVGDKCRVLPNCHHCFHVHCVDLWLVKTPFCPVCRTSARGSPIIHSNISEGSNTPSNDTRDELL